MKIIRVKLLLLIALPLLWVGELAAQASYDLRSPDNRIEIRIRTAERLHYDVLLSGKVLLENSTLTLNVEHKTLGVAPKVVEAKPRSNDQIVEPVVRQKFAKIRDHYNELRLSMQGGYAVTFRAYNEGAAYRWEIAGPQSPVKIYGEEANLNFPSNFLVYYPQEDSFFSHNERKYLPQHLGKSPQTSLPRCRRWSMWEMGPNSRSRNRTLKTIRASGCEGRVGTGWRRPFHPIL